jgi:drug/metabolite transporter (DMT)-like permease
MKHLYILTIVAAALAYLMLILLARDLGDTWGYMQWAGVAVLGPFLTLISAACWNRLEAT